MQALLLAATISAANVPTQDPQVAVRSKIEATANACVRNNAAEVERVEPSLSGAVAFLTEDLCAREVKAIKIYTQNAAILRNIKSSGDPAILQTADPRMASPEVAALQAEARARFSKACIDPETGELRGMPGPYDSMNELDNGHSSTPPELRAFAARAVLDARKARLASQPSR